MFEETLYEMSETEAAKLIVHGMKTAAPWYARLTKASDEERPSVMATVVDELGDIFQTDPPRAASGMECLFQLLEFGDLPDIANHLRNCISIHPIMATPWAYLQQHSPQKN